MKKQHSLTYAPQEWELREELWSANQDLQDAYAQFDQVSDPELVEACVYQISALKARCNYLLRRIKALQAVSEEEACAAVVMKGGRVCQV